MSLFSWIFKKIKIHPFFDWRVCVFCDWKVNNLPDFLKSWLKMWLKGNFLNNLVGLLQKNKNNWPDSYCKLVKNFHLKKNNYYFHRQESKLSGTETDLRFLKSFESHSRCQKFFLPMKNLVFVKKLIFPCVCLTTFF